MKGVNEQTEHLFVVRVAVLTIHCHELPRVELPVAPCPAIVSLETIHLWFPLLVVEYRLRPE